MSAPGLTATGGRSAERGVRLRLGSHGPLHWTGLLEFLAARAAPGVEAVADDAYVRTVRLGGAAGWIEVRPLLEGTGPSRRAEARSGEAARGLWVSAHDLPPDEGAELPGRLRRLFDLDADLSGITEVLGRDSLLGPCLARAPGLRVPGAWDDFEIGVRAILGQQVSVAGATTLTGRLVAELGGALPRRGPAALGRGRVFPVPEQVLGRPASSLAATVGIPRARAEALRAWAAFITAQETPLHARRRGDSLEEWVARLCTVRGIGPWTAHYLAMRAGRWADAFPSGDLVLRRAVSARSMETPATPASRGRRPPIGAAALSRRAEPWRPWRAYAAMHLWRAHAQGYLSPL